MIDKVDLWNIDFNVKYIIRKLSYALKNRLISQEKLTLEFDNKFTKVKTIEKINVGKRIRDISYSSTKKLFFLALESKQANLGILYKK